MEDELIDVMKMMQPGIQEAADEHEAQVVLVALLAWAGKVARQADVPMGQVLEAAIAAYEMGE